MKTPDIPRDITDITCATYDANASSYGALSEDYGRFDGLREQVGEFARDALPDLPILDLGCGGGRDSRLLASLGRKVVAGDYAPALLRWARAQAVEADHPPAFLRLNALALPLRDGSVAGVWASGSLLHVPLAGMDLALSEVRRVLAPGGAAAISMRDGDGEGWRHDGSIAGDRWFTLVRPQRFAERLGAAGFSDVQVRFAGRPGWFVALGVR